MRNRFSDPGEACQPYQDDEELDTNELDTNDRYHQQEDDQDLMLLTRDPYEDDDLYDRVEADRELAGRRHIEDTHVESCTNCGAYHSRPTHRCSTCDPEGVIH